MIRYSEHRLSGLRWNCVDFHVKNFSTYCENANIPHQRLLLKSWWTGCSFRKGRSTTASVGYWNIYLAKLLGLSVFSIVECGLGCDGSRLKGRPHTLLWAVRSNWPHAGFGFPLRRFPSKTGGYFVMWFSHRNEVYFIYLACDSLVKRPALRTSQRIRSEC